MRQKQGTYIAASGQGYQNLSQMGLVPGMKLFLSGVTFSKNKGFGQFNLAAYWQRQQRGRRLGAGWYILTNLDNIDTALQAYKARSGIEAMFRDYKSGGYHLEDCQAPKERLTRLVLLIALASTCSGLNGQKIKRQGQQRLSTVAAADLIVVIEGGNIVEQGSHEQLMAIKRSYYYLSIQQLKGQG